jgi:hypothetical protein
MRETLLALKLPQSAIDWLLTLYDCIQSFDDYADGDVVARPRLNALIWNTLVAMPANSFFHQNAAALLPVLGNAVLKWQASDIAEKSNQASAMAYAWRASFYDVVLTVVQLVHGAELAAELSIGVMQMYGETFDEYKKEWSCQAQQ